MKKLVFLSFVAFVASLLLFPQGSSAVTVSPPIIEIDAKKGDIITEKIRVTNDSDVEQTYYISAQRFVAEGESGAAAFIEDDNPLELVNWLDFPVTSVTVGPDERKVVPFSITIPDNADPGGHFASIFLSTTPPATGDGSQVSIGGRVGVLLLTRVEGNVVESAKIRDFAAEPSTINALPANFNIRIENEGNVHLKPQGNITISSMFGNIAAIVDVNQQGSNVLPDSVRELDAQWVTNPNAVAGEDSSFWAKYRQEKENFAFGKFTADLNMVYGGTGKTLTASTTFWVIPWRVLLYRGLWAAVIIALLVIGIRRYNQWIIDRASQRPVAQKKKK